MARRIGRDAANGSMAAVASSRLSALDDGI